jgi:hypothetical protein
MRKGSKRTHARNDELLAGVGIFDDARESEVHVEIDGSGLLGIEKAGDGS